MEFITFLIAIVALVITLRNKRLLKKINANTNLVKEIVNKDLEKSNNLNIDNNEKQKSIYSRFILKIKKSILGRFFIWLKRNLLMKIGTLFILAALSWFVRYAYVEKWIGAYTVIFFGLLIAISITIYGFFDTFKIKERGLILLGLGNISVLMVTFAARYIYGMFTPEIVFGLMFIVLGFVVFAAVKFNSAKLLGFNYLFATIMPFLLVSKSDNFLSLFSYLLFINIIHLIIIYYRQWHSIIVEILIANFVYSAIFFDFFRIGIKETFLAYLLAILLMISSTVVLLKIDFQLKINKIIHPFLFLLNTLFIIFWTIEGLFKDLHNIVFLGWAFILAVAGFLFYLLARKEILFIVFGLSTLSFLSLTAINLLKFEFLLAFFAVEVLISILVVAYLTKNYFLTKRTSLLMIVPTYLSFFVLPFIQGKNDIFNVKAISLYFFVFILMVSAEFIRRYFKNDYKEIANTLKVLWGIAIFWILTLIWIIPHVSVGYSKATFISIAIYTIVGIILYFNKHQRQQKLLQKFGVIMLSGVIIHIIFIDVWYLNTLGKISVFILVGVALISTAYRMTIAKSEDGELENTDFDKKYKYEDS